MRVFIQSPDTWGRIDGTVRANLLNFFTLTSNQSEADVVVVPVSFYDNFIFNESLYKITKPLIILDYLEYGQSWKAGTDTHVLGRNTANFANIASEQWMRLDAFVRDHKPAVYFKRELLERERSEWLQPIEFPCYLPAWPAQSKEEFDKRPIEVFMSWGLSHACRQALHGEMFSKAIDNGITMISAWDQFDRFDYENHKRVWASVHTPHITRVDISTVVHNQSRAKISLSLPGNGYRCFRDTEAPVNSVMACWEDGIARSYPWIHGVNCIRLMPKEMYLQLKITFDWGAFDLHELYLAGLETVEKMRSSNYVNNYITPIIQSSL
jgi:hypothetical protein